jgi:transposase-like protein
MARSQDARKQREWQGRLKRFEQSRQTVAAFCREEGVSTASFYAWRRRLTQRSSQAAREQGEAPRGFTPVRLVGSASITARLPGGTQLEIPIADARVLRLALDTLARADAQRAGGAPC